MYNKLEADVKEWGYAKGIISCSDAKTQTLKSMSEMGELADAVAKGEPIHDHVGDILVTLILLCEIKNTSITECLQVAYDEIKDRTGVLVNGTFIKDIV